MPRIASARMNSTAGTTTEGLASLWRTNVRTCPLGDQAMPQTTKPKHDNTLTAMLCDACHRLEVAECLPTSGPLPLWWDTHKKLDAARKERERREADAQRRQDLSHATCPIGRGGPSVRVSRLARPILAHELQPPTGDRDDRQSQSGVEPSGAGHVDLGVPSGAPGIRKTDAGSES